MGPDNIFIFGLTAEEVSARRSAGYRPGEAIEHSRELSQALTAIASGVFSPDDESRYAGLVGELYNEDRFMVCADFDAYARAQRAVDALWRTPSAWWACAIRNTAGVGWFSSDRTIGEYATDIWG